MSRIEEMLADSLLGNPDIQAMGDAYKSGQMCLSCWKPSDSFFVVLGSGTFYMKTLTGLGVPPPEALRLGELNRGKVRRIAVCADCAESKGYGRPTSWADSVLLADGNPDSPAPFKFLAENEGLMKSFMAEAERKQKIDARRKEKEMRVAGAQKEIRELVTSLAKQGYFIPDHRDGGGHIPVFQFEGGPRITSISMTPRSPVSTVRNVLADIARWERANARPEEVKEKTDVDKRTRRSWTLAEKAAIVKRYDETAGEARLALLAQEGIRHDMIRNWRAELQREGWGRIPPAANPGETRMCVTCGEDKPLTTENFTVTERAGVQRWSDQCLECATAPALQPGETLLRRITEDTGAIARERDPVHVVVPGETTAQDQHDLGRILALRGRQREIKARLGVIDAERAALVARLDEEQGKLTAELDEVQTALFDLVTG